MAPHSHSIVQSRSILPPTVPQLDLVEWLSSANVGLCHLSMGNSLALEHAIAKVRSRNDKAYLSSQCLKDSELSNMGLWVVLVLLQT